MVKNNGIPVEVKKPFETVYELKNEVPSFEEFMKTYESDDNLNYDDLNSGSISEVEGYGPCKICIKFPEPRWVKMEMTCPAVGCSAVRSASGWYHSGCGGYAIISTKAQIKCSRCSETRHITKWRFRCSAHNGTTDESVNYNSFNKALGWVLQNIENCDSVIRDLGIYMTNHEPSDW